MRPSRKAFLFLASGLLPLWLGLPWVLLQSGGSPDQREHAWWTLTSLVVIGCPITLFLTAAGFVGYHLGSGDAQRKGMSSVAAVLIAGVVAVLGLAGWQAGRPGLLP